MPSQCAICYRWAGGKSTSKRKFKHIQESPHAEKLRLFVRLKPCSDLASVCNRCYSRISEAARTGNKVVLLPSAVGRSAGNGVFAMEDLAKGDVATTYDGLEMDYKQRTAMPTTSHMRTKVSQHVVIDARAGHKKHGKGGLGGFINCVSAGGKPNVKMVDYRGSYGRVDLDGVFIKVLCFIAAGSELLTTYGHGYKMPSAKQHKGHAGRPEKALPPSQLSQGYKDIVAENL